MAFPEMDRACDTACFPELIPFYDQAQAADWTSLRPRLTSAAGGDRTFLLSRLAEVDGTEQWLWPLADGDPVAAVALARREVVLGWRQRHTDDGDSPERLGSARTLYVRAERRLTAVIAHLPDSGDAWAARLETAIGLELGPSEARRRFSRVQRWAPHDIWAHRTMLRYLAPSWLGSVESRLALAREAAAQAPMGSLLRALPAFVHAERWAELGGLQNGMRYLQGHDVFTELARASAESVLHPDCARGLGWAEVANTFAMLFHLAESSTAAAAHFRVLAGRASQYPWTLLSGFPYDHFTAAQRETRIRSPW